MVGAKKRIRNSTAEFLIFTSQAGENSIEVRVENETVWLTQKLIAELFGKSVSTINGILRTLMRITSWMKVRHLENSGIPNFLPSPPISTIWT